jgi:hypothetical protein
MSNFTVISAVTRTLATLMHGATGMVVDINHSPAESDQISTDPGSIGLYLYRIEKNQFFINSDVMRPSRTLCVQPPIGVNLFFLITPYLTQQVDIQTTIGQVIKLFHEQPVIPQSALDPALADTTEEVRVLFQTLPLEQMIELWRAFDNTSYRLSLTYEVSVALIDSSINQTVIPVEERHITVMTRR